MNMTLSFQPLIDHPLVQALQTMTAENQGQLYLVGGAVRDFILGDVAPKDLDLIVLNTSAQSIARAFADCCQGHYVPLDEDFGIYRVVVGDTIIDISDALNNLLMDDLGRRDLTINAMALCVETGEFYDRFEGAQHLADKTVQMVSETNLLDDPLRLLRVFRLAAQIHATHIDEQTLAVVQRAGAELLKAAPERIHYEFLKLLSQPQCFPFLQAMANTGLLEVILPELIPTHQVPPNGHHHLGLFEHTLELVRQAERLLPQFPAQAQAHLLADFNGLYTHAGLVKLACLLHDVGKPETMELREDGRFTFYAHDALSEKMTEVIGRRWKLSNDIVTFVKKLVRWHLYPCQFGPESSRKSVLRFFRRMGDETYDVLLLALADRFSTCGPDITQADLDQSLTNHLWLAEQFEAEQAVLKLPRLLSGHDIMNLLNLKPGPHLKEIINALEEAQQLGEIQTAEAAKAWLKKQY